MAVTFRAVLVGEGTASAIVVPEEQMAQLGPAKRYPVVVTINDYSYRNSVSWYKGAFMISVASAIKAEAGVASGDDVLVTLEHDDAPRVVELPDELSAALASAGVLEKFRALSYSKQRSFVDPWVAAKSQETRDKNLAKIVAAAR